MTRMFLTAVISCVLVVLTVSRNNNNNNNRFSAFTTSTTDTPTTEPGNPSVPAPAPVTSAPTTAAPVTAAPSESAAPSCSNHRHRKAWQECSADERQLYIDGFKALADAGITQQYTLTHLQSSEHSSSKFLPWHREFVFLLENSIRGLGGRFTCFTLPYWDWSREPLPTDVRNNGAE